MVATTRPPAPVARPRGRVLVVNLLAGDAAPGGLPRRGAREVRAVLAGGRSGVSGLGHLGQEDGREDPPTPALAGTVRATRLDHRAQLREELLELGVVEEQGAQGVAGPVAREVGVRGRVEVAVEV